MAESLHEVRILPDQPTRYYWRNLWLYRDLLWFLAWRDVLVRYKQTVMGIAWAIIRPLLTMLVFTAIFSLIARMPSVGSAPYPIMVFAGLLPWSLFANGFSGAASSLIGNESMITKVYFPRMILPLSSISVSLLDFLIATILLVPLFFWFNFFPNWKVISLPFLLILAVCAALGPGLLVAALNIKYRDFRHILPFVLQIGLYISPVGYSSELIPERWRLLFSLNPMAGVIDGFRWALLADASPFHWPAFLVSFAVNCVFLIAGFSYFRRSEKSFADVI